MALLTALEDHLEGDPEQKNAAGDAEGRQGDAEHRQDGRPGDREQRQHREADDARPHRHLAALGPVHARRERQEQRREPRRVDGHQKGDEGVEHGFEAGHHRLAIGWIRLVFEVVTEAARKRQCRPGRAAEHICATKLQKNFTFCRIVLKSMA